MTSEKQKQANQENAQKSTGPKTEQGKTKAKFNARRHGLTGQFTCMSEGDEIAYNEFRDNLLATLKPAGAYESQLAITIIQNHWSVNRMQCIEINIFADGADKLYDKVNVGNANVHSGVTMVRTFMEDDRYFSNIALYITRMNRVTVSTENRLKALREEREAKEAQAAYEAELLLRLAAYNNQTLEDIGLTPSKSETGEETIEVNGFVLSCSAIRKTINRKQALADAARHEKQGWNPAEPQPKRA